MSSGSGLPDRKFRCHRQIRDATSMTLINERCATSFPRQHRHRRILHPMSPKKRCKEMNKNMMSESEVQRPFLQTANGCPLSAHQKSLLRRHRQPQSYQRVKSCQVFAQLLLERSFNTPQVSRSLDPPGLGCHCDHACSCATPISKKR